MPTVALPSTRASSAPVLLASVATGVLAALVVAAFEHLTSEVAFEYIIRQPGPFLLVAPVIGIILANLTLRFLGRGADSSTSDEYVRNFHERTPALSVRQLPAKLLAGVFTMGSGGALGLEGPSIYAGSTVGLAVHGRLQSFFRRGDAHLLLTAGAAAGIAAVFKAPATGVIFALEAPYRDDITPQALLPSLLASAASYVTFVAIVGSEPVIPFLGDAAFIREAGVVFKINGLDILGALVLGLGAGLGGRGFAWLVRWAKRTNERWSLRTRIVVAGAVLALLSGLAQLAFDQVLTLGGGTEAMEWVVGNNRGLGLIALLFGLRLSSTIATLVAGGIGGVFIPLATLGVILGQFVGTAVGEDDTGLYPTLGLAAFLAAGYRTPITAVMFVAESTGSGSFVVPALVAAAVSQLVAGPESVAGYQRGRRLGHLERRFTLPLTSILTTDVLTVPSDATVSEFVYMHVLGRRQRVVPVVDGGLYVGMARLADVSEIDRDAWEATNISDVMATNIPTASPSWTLRDVVVAMEESESDLIAVVDGDGQFIGVVLSDDVVRIDEILDQTEGG